ncbi:4-(cytidine 5'-diphospho)-2-C-methyl-D-erythritol kinase [Miniphocaeibacter massiliensis]|uniref:4-(cytidine 5'-diphospho)-2-C-methyl-D-erythritol kinase n=1 Tax=Miniphocaeibacter massiliensis TaxID=2041841 RepID=UPI000C1C67DA|nr:4-(cytidine 5'-diphospho)-2-C-methyl-D-erythritol kinase [Miniphocaeibacter massiliensis]
MYKINSYAKINLSLDVLNKREDGYHNIDTIMQLIELKDIIEIEKRNDNLLNIKCNKSEVPTDKNNLIYKVWDILRKYKENDHGLNVYIEKNIPVAAGLAGGSSNAAYFMKKVNEIWNLNLSCEKLMEIGSKIGADIPYFFEEGTVRAEGIGNKFTKLKNLENLDILLVNSGCEVSTKYVYDNIKLSKKSNINKLIESINLGEIFNKSVYYNTMTEVSVTVCPEIKNIIDEMYELGAKISLMSGSGASVFGIFENESDINRVYEKIKDKYKFVLKTKTI